MTVETVLKKTPYEERYYDFDFAADLDTGETIASAALTATPAGLTIEPTTGTISGAKVQAKFKAGTAGTTYHVSCQIVTSTQKREACGDLYVEVC